MVRCGAEVLVNACGLSHLEAGRTSALVGGEPRALYWSETIALYARTITFAAYRNGRVSQTGVSAGMKGPFAVESQANTGPQKY